MGSPKLVQFGKFWHFWTLARRGPCCQFRVHAAKFRVHAVNLRGPCCLLSSSRNFHNQRRGVAGDGEKSRNGRASCWAVTWSKIEPEQSQRSQKRPEQRRIGQTWPDELRLDLNAALLTYLADFDAHLSRIQLRYDANSAKMATKTHTT